MYALLTNMLQWLTKTWIKFNEPHEDKTESTCHYMMHNSFTNFFILSSVCFAVIVPFFLQLHIFFSNQQTDFITHYEGMCNSKSRKMELKDRKAAYNLNLMSFENSLSASREHPKSDLSTEIQASLNLAKQMWEKGKFDTATKIYQHALALDPSHPDVLNEYGEFLEKNHQDIIKAEHMYCRALVSSPQHSKALSNRRRTLPLVEEIDQNNFNRIERKRDIIIKVPDSHPGLRRMKKESYFKHVHHTTALEGNTFTLSQTRSLIETRIVVAGKSIMEHNEILGMDAALHYVNSTLVHRIGAITIDDLLDIQKRVLGFVDPIGAGQFRTTQVFVGDHIPPAASEIDQLMDDFIQWLNSEDALSLHPIEFAALAHYKLVYIHPFYDGNGRTSRLLMNLILMQAGYPPIIIRKEEKQAYYDYLEAANAGDIRPFIRFIARCTERTLDEYIWATNENAQAMSSIFVMDDGRTIIVEPDNENTNKPVDFPKTNIENKPVDNDINNNDENNNGENVEKIHVKP